MLEHATLGTLKRHWLVVAALALAGALTAFVVSSLMTPLYRATASQYLTLSFGNTASDLAQGSTYTSNQMLSFGQLASSPVVLEPVIEELDLDLTVPQLQRMVSVSTPRDTVIMGVSVESADPERAAVIANAIARQARTVIEEYAPQRPDGTSTVQVRTVSDATPPQFQFAPDKRTNTLLGGLAGLLAGVLAAFAIAALDNRVRGEASLAEVGDVTFLGTLRQRPNAPGQEGVVLQDPTGNAAEDYRQLRSSMRYATLSKQPLTVVVSSSTPQEGKSTVSLNLAAVIAESGQRVLLIEADLRRPRLAHYAQVDGGVGMTDVLVGVASLADAVQTIGDSGLDVLPAGGTPPNPGELLASTQMADLIAHGRQHYDTVIIDTAPLLAVADALALAEQADGLVLVGRSNVTRKRDMQRALETAVAAGVTVFGAVLNGTRPPSARTQQYYAYPSEAPPRKAAPDQVAGATAAITAPDARG